MTRCRACAAAVPDGARFCHACGAAVSRAVSAARARKPVTVVFCDLAGSTELAGTLDAESLRSVMSRYFELMRDCLVEHGGTVEKFIGDAVMAVFGVPRLHEDDALRAARAALDMLAALDGLNEELRRAPGVRLAVRIGIDTGEAATSGDPSAGQALAWGEVVNVAARLQQSARTGEILIGPETRRAVARVAVTEPLGPLPLKGKADAVAAWRLLGLRADDPAVVRRFDTAFIGREDELRNLRRIADRALGRRECHLVTLYGDAGIGKTRLARHWLAEAEAEGALVGAGRCRAYGSGGSLLALADALRQLLDAAAPAASAPEEAEALSVLRKGLMADGTPSPSAEDAAWAVASALALVGRSHPVVLALDDCQWAGPALFALLDRVTADLRDIPMVLLCTARPDLLDRRPGWGRGAQNRASLTLAPLSPDEARLLAQELRQVVSHGAEGVDTLVERAEGNPFYLEQLLAMAEDGLGAGPAGLPPTMHALIAARVDALEPAHRAVLDGAAVAGREFSLAEVAAALDGEPDRGARDGLGPVARALMDRRLIEPTRTARGRGVPYRFASALIHEVAYAGLAKRTRAECHERLADWLADSGADDEVVGSHLERAYRHRGDLDPRDERADRLRLRAAERLAAAGAAAMNRCDLVRAADLTERAVALHGPASPAGLAAAERLGETLFALGRAEEGRRTLTAIAQAHADPGAGPADTDLPGTAQTVVHARMYLACMDPAADFAASVETARSALPAFEAAGDDLGLARVWLRIGQHEQLRGRYAASTVLLDRSLRHAAAADAGLERATAVGALAVALWLGPIPAESAVEFCHELLGAHADRRAVRAVVHCPLAVLHALRGDEGAARGALATAAAVTGELGLAAAQAFLPLFTGTVDLLAGRLDRAEAQTREARRAALRLGDAQLAAAASRNLARVLMLRGRYARDAVPGRTAARRVESGSPANAAEAYGIRARVLASRGSTAASLELADRAVAEAARTDSPTIRATARLDRAHVLAALGRGASARSAALAARRDFTRKGHLVGRTWADALLDRLGAK